MEDKDLINLWNADNQNKSSLPSIDKIDKQKSQSIFEKIKRNIKLEFVTGTIVFILAVVVVRFYFGDKYDYVLWSFLALNGLLSYFVYFKFLQRLKRVNEANMLNSLHEKIDILSLFISQLKTFVIIITPIAFNAGILVGINFRLDLSVYIYLILIVINVISIWTLYKLAFKMIDVVYGKYLVKLQNLYSEMTN